MKGLVGSVRECECVWVWVCGCVEIIIWERLGTEFTFFIDQS